MSNLDPRIWDELVGLGADELYRYMQGDWVFDKCEHVAAHVLRGVTAQNYIVKEGLAVRRGQVMVLHQHKWNTEQTWVDWCYRLRPLSDEATA